MCLGLPQTELAFACCLGISISSVLFYSEKCPGVSEYMTILTGIKTGIPGRGDRIKKGTGRKCLTPSGNHMPALHQAVTSFL